MPAQLQPTAISDSAAGSGSEQFLVRHLDLFSGIGGFALAAQWVGGIETVGFCEIDPWAQEVLTKNFPTIPIHDDVKTLDPTNYGRIDLITGGYPCQPFSVAGERRGENDDRHLWPEVFRIIKTARPRWVLCENVTGHVTMGLDEVLSDLGAEGYSAESIIIPASAVGAGHRRNRVWIIANSQRTGWEGRIENDSLPSSEKTKTTAYLAARKRHTPSLATELLQRGVSWEDVGEAYVRAMGYPSKWCEINATALETPSCPK